MPSRRILNLDFSLPISNSEINLNTHETLEFIKNHWTLKRVIANKKTISLDINVKCLLYTNFIEYLERYFGDTPYQSYGMYGFYADDEFFLNWSYSNQSLKVEYAGDEELVSAFDKSIREEYVEYASKLRWVYNRKGESVDIPLIIDRLPIDEFYPFLGERSLQEYYDDFMNSTASVLVLIGQPGTAKTTFIKGLLAHTKRSAYVTYDVAVMSEDHIFAEFIESSRNFMIIEDADNILKSRKDGNDVMYKFLNVGDGLISSPSKKLILSTNLPTAKDIDPALIRPGRCYGVLDFRPLNRIQAEKVAVKFGLTLAENKTTFTIAEIFNPDSPVEERSSVKQKVGF